MRVELNWVPWIKVIDKCKKELSGVNIVAWQIKLSPAMLASPVGPASCLGCSTFSPALC